MVQVTSDISLSGASCTTAVTPSQLVQSSSENYMLTCGPAQKSKMHNVEGLH
ncbi:NTP-binding protein [Aeromonas salmonicida]|nr:NTP-binding protein [Aeromonas salmonicida]TNI40945.1 NTP-binding protein [Aeromonas salmonicida]